MKKYILGFVFGAVVFTGASVAFADENGKNPLKTLLAVTQAIQLEINNLWSALADVQLTPGPQGQDGAQGIQGPIGLQGAQGLKGDVGLTGTQGSTGAVGPKGDSGAQGASGTIATQIVVGTPFVVRLSSSGNAFATATCPAGKSVLGGGANYVVANGVDNSNAFSNAVYNGVRLTQSFPSAIDTWQSNVIFFNTSGASLDLTLTAYAICTL